MFRLLIPFCSVRTATVAVPIGGYGVVTGFSALETSTVVFAALLLSIVVQLHRAWFFYTPIIQQVCQVSRQLYVGQLIAYLYSAVIAIAVLLAMAHRHLAAELVLAIQQCITLALLFKIYYRHGFVRKNLLPWLANELMHVLVLGWLFVVTLKGTWNDSHAAELSIVVSVVIVSCHYVVHLLLEEYLSDELDVADCSPGEQA